MTSWSNSLIPIGLLVGRLARQGVEGGKFREIFTLVMAFEGKKSRGFDHRR